MNAIPMETLLSVDPNVAARAERVEFAVRLIRVGRPKGEIIKRIQSHFQCSQPTAWRAVYIAKDLA